MKTGKHWSPKGKHLGARVRTNKTWQQIQYLYGVPTFRSKELSWKRVTMGWICLQCRHWITPKYMKTISVDSEYMQNLIFRRDGVEWVKHMNVRKLPTVRLGSWWNSCARGTFLAAELPHEVHQQQSREGPTSYTSLRGRRSKREGEISLSIPFKCLPCRLQQWPCLLHRSFLLQKL